MDALTRRQFDRAMFAKDRTLAIRVGDYASRDIKEASFEYGYIKGDTYKPGGTCAGSGKITFTSIITTFNKLDILHPEIGLLVGNTYQWVKMGEYFINDIEIDRNRNTTTLELMDGMFKLNREYVTDLHFPAEVREVIQEICLKTGIELANDYFGISAMRYHIEQVPEGKKLSFRDMLSAMTQMIGMSCFFNREGKMEIRDLNESNITINADSYFLHGLTKSEIEYQIAGITCKTDKKSLTVGMKTGRSLELDNVFMTQSALNDLYYKLKNLTYYPYNLNYQGHLLLEVGQWVTIQTNKKETFKVPVLSQSFTFKGGLRGRISADSKAGNDTQYSYEGTITKRIKQQDGIEAKIQAQIEAADAAFDAEFKKRKKEIDDGIEQYKAKTEEVKQDISNEIDKRFQNFDNASIQEARRKAEEALQNAGASTLLAQEAKRIGLDSLAKLDEFKRQATSAQTALSGDLDVLKQTIAKDIRPKQAQVTAEIAKQVEALNRTKNELAGVKSAQATYEETTTRRLAELTNLANGKASKSELTQTAEELASRIASVKVGGRNLLRGSKGPFLPDRKPANFDNAILYVGQTSIYMEQGQEYIISAKTDGTFTAHHDGNKESDNVVLWIMDKDVRNYQIVSDLKTGTTGTKIIWNKPTGIYHLRVNTYHKEATKSVWDVKIEKGNVATDWSPALEDIEGQISTVESNFRQRADALDAGVSRLTEGLRTKADISVLNVTAENIRQSVKSLETSTQNKLDQKLSLAEFEVQAGSIRQEILNATKDKADKTLVVAEAGKLREEFSNLRVGGRNLLRGSKGPFLPDRKPANFDNAILYVGQTSIYMEQGQEYIISAKTDGTFTAHHDGNKESDNVVLWIMDKDVRNYQIVSDLKTGTTGTKIIWNKPTGIYHLRVNTYHKEATKSVWDVKIEKGNVATDWSPAPEDTDGVITEAKATFERTAQGLRTDLSAIQEYVNKDGQRQEALQRYSREESAKQATAVRELVTRDYVGKATYQEDVRGIERKFESITNPKTGSIATQIANYKIAVNGRFADITSMIAGKANQSDFQRVKETSQLYERILGGSGSSDQTVKDNIARLVMTNQLFQTEVGRYSGNGVNRAMNTTSDWGPFISRSGGNGVNLHADLHKILSSGFKAGDTVHVRMEISIDDVQRFNDKQIVAILQSYGDVTNWARAGRTFDYNIGTLQPGNNWRLIEFDTVMTEEMLRNNSWMLNLRIDGASSYKVHTKAVKVEKGNVASAWSAAPEDTDEAVRSVQSQLAGSWAVQNINSAGSIVSQINATNNQILVEAEKIRFKGKTLADQLTAIDGYFKRLFVGEGNFATLNTEVLKSNSITADKLVMDMAMARLFVSSDIFTNTLASKTAFINKLQSVIVSSTLLEGYKGWIGGFQIGTHDSGSGRWLTGRNHFSVGMGDGEGGSGQTALWVNWGGNWSAPGYYAWFVKNNGKMYCYNTAEFWNTPIVNGDLKVTGNIIYDGGAWIYSNEYVKIGRSSTYYFYLEKANRGRDYFLVSNDTSDRRLKSNIQESSVSGIDVINRLKTYSYRKEFNNEVEDISCGIMAQDVQKYAPDAFREAPDGVYTYNTFALVPYLIKAIQELNQKIEKMEKTIA